MLFLLWRLSFHVVVGIDGTYYGIGSWIVLLTSLTVREEEGLEDWFLPMVDDSRQV